MEKKICPICGNPYTGHPALSRTNDKTEICSDCGIRQSLQSIGIAPEEQEKILSIIHRPQSNLGATLPRFRAESCLKLGRHTDSGEEK